MPENEGDSKNSFHQLLPSFYCGFLAWLGRAAHGVGAIVGNDRGECGQKIERVNRWQLVCWGLKKGREGNCNR